MNNLLTDPIINTQETDGQQQLMTLPEVMAAVCAARELTFPGLRPHQKHSWNAFVTQLAYLALTENSPPRLPTSPEEWQRAIRALTPSFPKDEPWNLIVEDPTKPAFLQPPVSTTEKFSAFHTKRPTNDEYLTPDRLDILIGATNLDLKLNMAWDYDLELWVFSLISLQTMTGHLGRGGYGISRMNYGTGNRPAMSISPSEIPTVQMRRDIITLLENHPNPQPGHKLIWTIPWDGGETEILDMKDLHAMYLEVARRVRLQTDAEGRITALRATSEGLRIDAKKLKGFTDDPWAPMETEKEEVLTVRQNGIGYGRISEILTKDAWRKPVLMSMNSEETATQEEMVMIFRATARAKGKTYGHFEYIWPINRRTIQAINASPEEPEHIDLGTVSERRIKAIGSIRRKLYDAIRTYANGGDRPNDLTLHSTIAGHYANQFDKLMNERFFQELQDEYLTHPEERQPVYQQWVTQTLMNAARSILVQVHTEDATQKYEDAQAHYKAMERMEASIRFDKGFADVFTTVNNESKTPEEQNATQQTRRPHIRTPADEAVGISAIIAQPRFSAGDLAELRRMNELYIEPPVFWQLMGQKGILGNQDTETKWRVIIQSMAMMTRPTNQPFGHRAHDGQKPVGAALWKGTQTYRTTPYYSEDNLDRFVNANGKQFYDSLIELAQTLGRANITWNWREMATMVLAEGTDPEQSKNSRRRIYRDYYRSVRKTVPGEPNNE